jgi:hypothetical protein
MPTQKRIVSDEVPGPEEVIGRRKESIR